MTGFRFSSKKNLGWLWPLPKTLLSLPDLYTWNWLLFKQAQQQEQQQNFANLQETDALDIIPNAEDFTCPICFEDIAVGNGVVLRECLHLFCK